MVGHESDPVELYGITLMITSDELNIRRGAQRRASLAPKLLEGLEPRRLNEFTPMRVANIAAVRVARKEKTKKMKK